MSINLFLHRIAKNFSLSIAGSIFCLAFGLIRIGLLTKNLSLADFGRLILVINLFQFWTAFLDIRVGDLIFRFLPKLEYEKDVDSAKELLALTIILGGGTSLLVITALVAGAHWYMQVIYKDTGLETIVWCYAIGAYFNSFGVIYSPILRLKDRFAAVIVPQVLGQALTVGFLYFYFSKHLESYSLVPVILSISAGLLVASIPPIILSVKYYKSVFRKLNLRHTFTHNRYVYPMLFHLNVTGYFTKLLFTPGDVFLLGLFTSPTHVAVYSLAIRLTNPLTLLDSNLRITLFPELVKLYNSGKFGQAYRTIISFIKIAAIVCFPLYIGFIFAAKPVIILLSNPAYLPALPIFYIMLATILFNLCFYLPTGPIILCNDKLVKARNIVLAGILLFIYVPLGIYGFSPLNIAVAKLASFVLIFAACSMPAILHLKKSSDNISESTT